MNPMLNIGVKAARRAGSVIMRHLDRIDELTIEQKGRNDFVSEVDRMAEETIIGTIQESYPDHGFLAEESGEHRDEKSESAFEWVIDPLDGTTNFLHGYPQFAVSIALRRKGVLEQAVVFDPLHNELFTASKGGGAQLNNRRMRVSKVSRLGDALLGTGFPFKEIEHIDPWMRTFGSLLPKVSGVRRAGSAALDLAYLACGRFDGFWEMGLKPWDMAAGCLLVREAGGLIADFQGEQSHLESGHIVAGNPRIFGQLLQIVRQHAGSPE
ncbi:MAG: inositol monophosphatase family protein [Pseudomonadota bacterium]|nr:inositol monophosphatase family protein [Pseudomonadota bacterium]